MDANPREIRAPAAGAVLPPPLLVGLVVAAGLLLGWIAPLSLPRGMFRILFAGGLTVAALALTASAVRALRAAATAVIPYQPTTALVTTGPFRSTRNPIYLAFLLVQASFAFAFVNGWLLVLLPVSWYVLDVVQVRREEKYLVKTFGEAYLAYTRRVRRWL